MVAMLVGGLLCACNNGEAELARAEAEKAKLEAEVAKARAQAEVAKAQAEAETAKAQAESEKARADDAQRKQASASAEAQLAALATKQMAEDAAKEEAPEVAATVMVSVPERKADGNAWDAMGGAPDLLVVLSANGKSVQGPVAQDRFNAEVKLPPLALKKGDTVSVVVVDQDMSQNDPIGSATVIFGGPGTKATLKGSFTGSIQF
jgi:hypothetical protein